MSAPRNKGFTLAEMLIAMAVVGVLIIPAMSYLKSSLKWLLFLDYKQKSENQIMDAVLELERDFKDMNEVVYCSSTRIDFYMDSYRNAYSYSGGADFDGDGEPNDSDIDDDNDGLDATRTVRQFFALVGNPASLAGWKSGLDLQDDDDDKDGKRDVLCRYQYFSGTRELKRQFVFNAVVKPWKVIASNVVGFTFTPSGGSPSEIDPNTGGAVPRSDVDGNGVLDLADLDIVTTDGILNSFKETRYVRDIRYNMIIRPNPKRPETNSISSTIRPPLMPVKEKFQ